MTGSLLLAVNGERHEVLDPDPVATLGDFLRGVGKTGVKIACGEGGCGACTVVVAEWCVETQTPTYRSVNACLVPLCSCDGMAVTTTEGLRPCGTGFHPLQERLAAKNGSQCGFCSPGMVMSMFGKLSRSPGPECPSAAEIEGALDGNLCRCTGYRAIIEAFQSFAGTPKDAVAGEKFAPFPDFLKRETKPPLGPFRGSGKEWIIPTSLSEVFSALRDAEAAHPEATVSLVAGHTCRGIYKEDHLTDVFINLQNVPELTAIEKSKGGIRFGGSVTTTVFIETLEGAAAEDGQDNTSEKNLPFSPPARRPELAALPVLAEHARRIAGHMVRNWGTIGGNLVMTKVKGFQSDLATILTGVGAKVSLLEGGEGKERELDADKFFSVEYQLPKHALLKSIFVPFLEPGEVFRSFKTAVRPQNSHAVVNAAFRVKMAGDSIEQARLVFGAFGSRGDSPGPGEPECNKGGMPGGPLRALRTEEVVAGKGVDGESLKKAVEALQTEAWWPEDTYERHLALGFLYKLFCVLKGPSPDEPFLRVSQTSDRPASKGSQKIAWAPPELKPIAESSPKFTSKLQAAGDVRYTNDLPEPKDCLYAAYVQVPRAKAIVKSIDCEAAMKMQGVFGVLTSEDIPGDNASDGLLPLAVQTKLLVPVGEPCQYAGQPCLAIFADSTRHAELAAKAVKLELEVPAEKPLLSAEACMKTLEPPELESKPGSDASPVASVQHSLKRGDAEAALQAAPRKVAGEIFCNSQKHFYMETQVALAVPGEDNTLNIWQSVQVPSWAHETLRRVTGLPKHKIVVNIPMVGGGFGGKLFRGMHVGCVAAVAAMKWRRAVRFALNRNADIVMTGGRVAMTVNYEAGFDEAGKLAAVRVKNLSDCGGMDPCTGFATMIANNNMEQIYGIPNVDLTVWKCNTDTPVGDEEYRANAAVLLGAYLIIRLNWSLSRLVKCLGPKEADLKFACAWARQALAEPQRVLSVRHCWQGLEVARQHRWIAPGFVNDEVETEKACTDYSNTLSRYDVAWIIPRLLMVGADPLTVIWDPNPMTCKQLFPAKHELLTDADSDDIMQDVGDGVKSDSAEKELEANRSTGSAPTDAAEAESECGSCDTVCKEYRAWTSEFDHSTVDEAEEPHDYVSFLQQSKIGIVVRANFDDEEGLPSSRCGYTDHALETYGICQTSIFVVDKNGGLPKPIDVARLLQACDGFMRGQPWAQDAVMVHCKGGFGRSAILACCLAISHLDIPGAALLGWVRIVRPGAFTVRAQEVFLRNLRGRRDVLRYARMPCSEESKGISCSAIPCNVQ